MKKFILSLMSMAFVLNLFAQKVFEYNLVFDANQIQLSEKQKSEINDLAKQMKTGERIVILPLTYDSVFSRYFFAKIAKKQAEEIKKYAEEANFEFLGMPSNLPTAYKGLSVSVNLKRKKKEHKITTGLGDQPADYSLRKHYDPKPSQFFTIDPNKDNFIEGEEGTKLFFKAGSLLSDEEVEIELKEFYTLADYMKNGLTTESNGEMIQSGGVIFLNARQKNDKSKQVAINQATGVDVELALQNNDEDMQIFVPGAPENDQINWVLPEAPRYKEDWQMTETTVDEYGNVISQKTYTSKEAWEKHLKEEKDIKKTEEKMASKLKIYNLGYINCDKFYNEPMQEYTIAGSAEMLAEYYIVYKDIRGVMKGKLFDNTVNFGKLPTNRTATLIAVSFIDEKAYYFEKNISIGSSDKPEIELLPVNESIVNEKLAALQ